MKNERSLIRPVLAVVGATAFILMIPFVAMQFTDEVNWGPSDFMIIGVCLLTTGLLYVLLTRRGGTLAYRLAMAMALGTALVMVWANLAVGLIGAGPNLGNLLYIAVLAVGIIAAVVWGFTPAGMARAMFATALALVALAVVALLAGMHEYPGSSVREVLGVNGFFAGLFGVAGLMFRSAGRGKSFVGS